MATNDSKTVYQAATDEMEIDLLRIARMLLRHIKAIVLWAVICAAAGAGISFLSPRSYTAATLVYVDYLSTSTGTLGGSPYTTSGVNLGVAGVFVDTFDALLNSDETLEQIIDQAGLNCTPDVLTNMLECEAVGGQMIRVDVSSAEKEQAIAIARVVADIMPEKLMDRVEGSNASVLEAGKLQAPSSPAGGWVNCLIGAAVGAAAVCALLVFKYLIDKHIYTASYLSAAYPGIPLLAELPDGKHASATAAEEAYKLLRAYLVSPGDETDRAQVIGLTSAVAGEGKTTAAVNLARVLACAGKKVLLLEGDMRHPGLAKALGLQDGPALSELLMKGQAEDAVRSCGLFDAAVCGPVPAAPSEVVSSPQMSQTVEQMRGRYDYVLIDLPDVMGSADAVAVSHMTDGMLVVVRAGRADQDSLSETMRRLGVAEVHILGFVFNGDLPAKAKG